MKTRQVETLPVTESIRNGFLLCGDGRKKVLLNGLSEEEFITARTELFLKELNSFLDGGVEPIFAEELAFIRCMKGLKKPS